MKKNYAIFYLVLISNQLSASIANKAASVPKKTQTKSNSVSSTMQNIYNALPDVTARGIRVQQDFKYQDINRTTLKDAKALKNQNNSTTYELANKDRYTVYGNNLDKGYFTKATYSNLPARTISDTIRTTKEGLISFGNKTADAARSISAYGKKTDIVSPYFIDIAKDYEKKPFKDVNGKIVQGKELKEMHNVTGSITYEMRNGDRFTQTKSGDIYYTKATDFNYPARYISDTIRPAKAISKGIQTTIQDLASAGSAIKSGTSYVAKNMYDAGIATGNAIKTGVTYAGEGLLSFGNKTYEKLIPKKTNNTISENNKNTDWKNNDFSNLISFNTTKISSNPENSLKIEDFQL